MRDDSLTDAQGLHQAIAAQEGLRGVVPDVVVDAAVASLREHLAVVSREAQRRRQVTVLFADVSGFTSMSSRLDAELVAELMNELWSRLDAIVADHGGRVDKHIGDAVMAVWGAAATQESDPERAVRAALAMQEELDHPASPLALTMRVGINTGPAHLGVVGSDSEFTVMGDTVNVASRVEGVAPVGGVLITHETYRHIRGVFDVEELDPAQVKGRSDPLRVYVVRQAKPRAFRIATRGVEGVETRMVGRAAELDVLQTEFDRSRATGYDAAGDGGRRCRGRQVATAVRVRELDRAAPGRASACSRVGRSPTRRSAAFGLVRDVLAERFGVLDSDTASAVADKLRRGFGRALDAERVGSRRALARVRPARQSGGPAPAGVGPARVGGTRPSVPLLRGAGRETGRWSILLEDLHWADDESLTLIDELVAHAPNLHLLVVGVGRPDAVGPSGGRGPARAVDGAFDSPRSIDAATRELVSEVLQKRRRRPGRAQRAHHRAGRRQRLLRRGAASRCSSRTA